MDYGKFISRIAKTKSPAPVDDDEPVNLADEAEETVDEFKADMAREKAGIEFANDTEYWCAIVFETREQKDAFLEALKLSRIGDKYLNGLRVAEAIGVSLPPGPKKWRPLKTATPRLKKLL